MHSHSIDYFAKLFKEVPAQDEEAQKEVLTKIPYIMFDEQNQALLKTIDREELKQVVFEMNKGKMPSPDGFPIMFFQIFWYSLEGDFMAVIEESRGSK